MTDKNGNIWAFPVVIDLPLIVYDEDHCAKQGITLNTDPKGFFDIIESLGDSEYYSYFQFRLRQSCFCQYLMRNDTFDTPLFREMAQTLKEHWDPEGETSNRDLILDMGSREHSDSCNENFLFWILSGSASKKVISESLTAGCALPLCRRSETRNRI